MKKVLAIIVTYNIGDNFIENLNILKQNVEEILIIDNGSKEETINILETIKDMASVVYLNKNMGIAYALNKGIEYGINNGYEWILTLDHDSKATKNMVNNMLMAYEGLDDEVKESIVMIAPKHIEEKRNNEIDLVINSQENDFEYVLTEITSGSLVKSDYYKNNLYDEKLFIDLVDHDFCLDINKKGYKIIRVNNAMLLHNLGESVPKSLLGLKVVCTNHNPLRKYYMTRNRMYIWKKYSKDFPQWVNKDKIKFFNENIKIVLFEDKKYEKIKMSVSGIVDYYKAKWGSFHEHH